MILADDMFRELTERAPETDSHGKRAAARVPVTMQAAVVPISGQNQVPLQAKVEDISPIGIGLIMPRAIAVGDSFAVRLRTHSGTTLWLISKTARCLARANGEFLVGAHFVRILQLNNPAASAHTQPSETTPLFADEGDWGATG